MRYLAKLLLLLGAALSAWPAEPIRERNNFDTDWRFYKGEAKGAEDSAYDDAGWRKLNLPHDWSIEGPYSASNASGTGFLPGGIGWYRKTFQLPPAQRGRKVFIEFDGVYRDSDVWINGRHLGHRPYGYASFEYDLTPYVNFGAKPNVVAVRVDHSKSADSRWYTGSGIYRHVWLTMTDPLHVAHWGTYVYTPLVREADALVSMETHVVNESPADAAVRLVTSFEEAGGREVASAATERRIAQGETGTFAQQAAIPNPKLWSHDSPYLYTAVTRVYAGGRLLDEYRTVFGIRTIRFDPNKGFFLNGKPEKLKGVCLHHDLGALGAAFSEAALRRRLVLLKQIGANAIRTSHNPMAPEEYDLCDRLGLLVMDEAFDEWTAGKKKWIAGWNVGTPGKDGYQEAFEKWGERDLEDMVLRDRNHPSIVLWSIGNEIDYPGDPFGHPLGRYGLRPGMLPAIDLPEVARRLIAIVKRLDGTRPVTQALADSVASNATGLASLLDVAGYNYLEQHYAKDHERYPERIILGSENSHSLAAWRAVAANDYVAGQFLWTGVDYLGESRAYPQRGSTAGLLDFCGFRKPQSYLRQALWSDRPMVYAAAQDARKRVVEHWNWTGDERKAIPVEVYTNCDSVELYLNGKSLGAKTVADRLEPVLRWEVPNEPGTVLAVGKRGGAEAARFELATAGPADRIMLSVDRTELRAAAGEFANVEIFLVDAAGRKVYGPDHGISVQVSGAGELAALDSGDPLDITPVQSSQRSTWKGRALALVRASSRGAITVRVSGTGLKPAAAALMAR
jgi:beta-galactosidase